MLTRPSLDTGMESRCLEVVDQGYNETRAVKAEARVSVYSRA